MSTKSVIALSLQRFSGAQRQTLETMAQIIRELLPTATEEISWNMPTFKISGVGVVAIEGFKAHNSLFPMSGSVPGLLQKELANYKTSKGTIQFDIDKPMPRGLIRKIIAIRIAEINQSYPKKNGEVLEFYANGVLKAQGRMKGDQLEGNWKWFRKDGSLMRTGAFKSGIQVGEWVTYRESGEVVKRTKMTAK